MATAAEIAASISENAKDGIKSVTSDGVTVTKITPSEQAEGQRVVAATAAMKKPARGLRFTRISPPGAV